jgi:hypothetical protein
MMGIFVAIIFAAQMLDQMLAGNEVIREAATGFVIATTIVAVVAAVLGFTPIYARTFMHIWGMTRSGGSLKMVTLSHHDWIVAAIRGGAAAAILLTARLRWQRAWMIVAGVLIAADLTYVTYELNPRMPRKFFDPPPVASRFPPNRADFRVFHECDWYGSEETARKFFSTGNAVYWVVRNGLFPMTPAGSKIRTVIERDYDKTALLPTIELTDSVWDVKRSGREDWWEPFMSMSNAWYRGTYRDYEVERKRVNGDFKQAMPVQFIETTHWRRYYFADILVTIHNRQDFVNVLSKQSLSPRVAFIKYPNFVPAAGDVLNVRETANRATLDVDSRGKGFLVMSVTPHKYWRITLDGKPVPAIVANIGFQGVVVPAGRHRVEMTYRNDLVVVGLWISATTLALLVGALIFYRR